MLSAWQKELADVIKLILKRGDYLGGYGWSQSNHKRERGAKGQSQRRRYERSRSQSDTT